MTDNAKNGRESQDVEKQIEKTEEKMAKILQMSHSMEPVIPELPFTLKKLTLFLTTCHLIISQGAGGNLDNQDSRRKF